MQAAAQGEDAWEEEEGCTMGGACGALGGEPQVELELELQRRGSGFGFASEEVCRATNRLLDHIAA